MIRYRLKELISDYEFEQGRRLTLDELGSATGISRNTLSRLTNVRGYNTTTDVLDKLCSFFRRPISDLVEHIEGQNKIQP